ncbi:MBL fold metallo-hydrolase [Streptomyces sp. NPDC058685]|uniref:MBL fold metallo-hydrolase n=1 Tax=Streptomyces sp. NPDC058685 TaxID=3346598 RepID=UPI003650E48F
MTALAYSVYVAPSKPAVSDDLPPGEDRRMWSPTASTLIFGERDAVLVDPLLTVEESRRLADWVDTQGKNVTTVFVTHAHGDHFFGAPALLDRFPQARLVAAADVAAHAGAQWDAPWFDGFWQPRFPDQISDRRVVPEPLPDGRIELEGKELRGIELGHTDTDGTSALYAPSIGLVVAGDAVYGDVHLYLGEAKGHGKQDWLHALDVLAELRPAAVVSGHKRDGDPDSPDDIDRTRRYIEDFATVAEKADNHVDLYETMVRMYPDRVNRGVLWNSAKSALP